MATSSQGGFRHWWRSGAPWIWLNAGAVSISLLMVFGLLGLIMVRGMGHFWPADILEIQYHTQQGSKRFIGEKTDTESVTARRYEESGLGKAPEGALLVTRSLIKTGNRKLTGRDFVWLDDHKIGDIRKPDDVIVMERYEWGNFYGYLEQVRQQGKTVARGPAAWPDLKQRVQRVVALHDQISRLEKHAIGAINYQLESLRLDRRRLELDGEDTPDRLAELATQRKALQQQYAVLRDRLQAYRQQIQRDSAVFRVMDGREVEIPLSTALSVMKPNRLSVLSKVGIYLDNFRHFLTDDPREANTEGGVFPAIFGTVMMVLVMSVLVTPMGVVAAVYLREYAKQGPLIRLIRIAVNNLAGVPSIVYGVFGLGFFVYFIGGNLDRLFFPEALPAPTFGTPGLLWASLTLALLTLPVVIVSTEEGLARIPNSFRDGSLALGASKFETIRHIILPMASPAIMTGMILAIARAAGEVAPLMLVGVVKLAPTLPLDGNFPFLHLERKFMHLGFHIYDVGFQSPNVEAARPLVYATSFLLVMVIIVLNISAILLRNRLRERYKSFDH